MINGELYKSMLIDGRISLVKPNEIAMIVAHDLNYHIGYEDNLLFRCSEDIKLFVSYTYGGVVICGRQTYDTMGNLSGRDMIVVTRDENMKQLNDEFVTYVTSKEEAIEVAQTRNKKIFVIGGGQIYKMFADVCKFIIVSKFNVAINTADTSIFNYRNSRGVDTDFNNIVGGDVRMLYQFSYSEHSYFDHQVFEVYRK